MLGGNPRRTPVWLLFSLKREKNLVYVVFWVYHDHFSFIHQWIFSWCCYIICLQSQETSQSNTAVDGKNTKTPEGSSKSPDGGEFVSTDCTLAFHFLNAILFSWLITVFCRIQFFILISKAGVKKMKTTNTTITKNKDDAKRNEWMKHFTCKCIKCCWLLMLYLIPRYYLWGNHMLSNQYNWEASFLLYKSYWIIKASSSFPFLFVNCSNFLNKTLWVGDM